MDFDFDIGYVNWNTILHVEILSSRKFNKALERSMNSENKIMHWIETETDVLPLYRLAFIKKKPYRIQH